LSLAAAGVDQLEPDESGGLGADWLVLLLGALLVLAAGLTVRSRTRARVDDDLTLDPNDPDTTTEVRTRS
jgi:hypothetical protein